MAPGWDGWLDASIGITCQARWRVAANDEGGRENPRSRDPFCQQANRAVSSTSRSVVDRRRIHHLAMVTQPTHPGRPGFT